MQRDDDEAWRRIVDNYGDRVELDPEEPIDDDPEPPGPDADVDLDDRERARREHPSSARPERSWDDPDDDWTTDRFVPPPPPPVPTPSRDRLAGWAGVIGAPILLVVLLLSGLTFPSWVPLLLVIAFVAGFGYLVATMSREPRDPGDDGAVL